MHSLGPMQVVSPFLLLLLQPRVVMAVVGAVVAVAVAVVVAVAVPVLLLLLLLLLLLERPVVASPGVVAGVGVVVAAVAVAVVAVGLPVGVATQPLRHSLLFRVQRLCPLEVLEAGDLEERPVGLPCPLLLGLRRQEHQLVLLEVMVLFAIREAATEGQQ
jgi:hypothetical protein